MALVSCIGKAGGAGLEVGDWSEQDVGRCVIGEFAVGSPSLPSGDGASSYLHLALEWIWMNVGVVLLGNDLLYCIAVCWKAVRCPGLRVDGDR